MGKFCLSVQVSVKDIMWDQYFSKAFFNGKVSPNLPNTIESSLFPLVSAGHKDSVTCAVFSHDSSMVATGDMGGLIKVWKVENKEEIWSFEVGDLEVRA